MGCMGAYNPPEQAHRSTSRRPECLPSFHRLGTFHEVQGYLHKRWPYTLEIDPHLCSYAHGHVAMVHPAYLQKHNIPPSPLDCSETPCSPARPERELDERIHIQHIPRWITWDATPPHAGISRELYLPENSVRLETREACLDDVL